MSLCSAFSATWHRWTKTLTAAAPMSSTTIAPMYKYSLMGFMLAPASMRLNLAHMLLFWLVIALSLRPPKRPLDLLVTNPARLMQPIPVVQMPVRVSFSNPVDYVLCAMSDKYDAEGIHPFGAAEFAHEAHSGSDRERRYG